MIAPRTFALALITFATFTDIVAYSVAVPVLPDLTRKLGASPTTVGLLFASFGATALCVAIPAGAVSDRMGRRKPPVGGLVGSLLVTLMLAYADHLPARFFARLAQGAADAVTWVVGFALLADLYAPEERGRASGIVMSGAGSAFVIGPSVGGWLYGLGGLRLPFLAVAGMAALAAVATLWLKLPPTHAVHERVPVLSVMRVPAVGACAAAVVLAAATMSMLEPVLALHLQKLDINPAGLTGLAAPSRLRLCTRSTGGCPTGSQRRLTPWEGRNCQVLLSSPHRRLRVMIRFIVQTSALAL